ncbi:MAG: DUF2279 domain-containing protein [Desulfamplus sp.]
MRYILLILILSHPYSLPAFETGFSKEQKVLITNISGVAAVTAWGVANWDYFQRSPSTTSEGWFDRNTKEGGADKLGHFYLSYTLSHLIEFQFSNWGYSEKRGALLGSISSFTIMNSMEIGDAFSDYGFSVEDFIMNGIGSAAAYLISSNPDLKKKIDFRVEYTPDFESIDFFTDYENLKYLIALKLDGFDFITQDYLKYFELHLGYYARGYSDQTDKERNIYIGVGINFSKILNDFSIGRISKLTNYVQIPYTYLSIEKEQ